MLTCIPKSFCSWDYRVTGPSVDYAEVTMSRFTEEGSIWLGSTEYTIQKQGLFSGRWSLEGGSDIVAEARKPSAMFRSFEVQSADVNFTLKAQSAFSRCYNIFIDSHLVGIIQPIHPFTRRATVDCSPEVPELAQLFSFWLAAMTWRRAARNSNTANS